MGALAVEFFVALILALGLACLAGVQYYYVMFLEARSRQQRRRIAELEQINIELAGGLQHAEARLEEELQRNDGELWPEVIDEDSIIR